MNNICKHISKEAIKIEMEHGLGRTMARKIACDHVKEMGRGYYPALKKMEAKLIKK